LHAAEYVPRERDASIKLYSDVFEAVLGAVFLDRVAGDTPPQAGAAAQFDTFVAWSTGAAQCSAIGAQGWCLSGCCR
jgi:hypothetical protein